MLVITILITVRDDKGKLSTTEFNFLGGTGITILEVRRLGHRLAGFIAPLLRGQIVRIGVALNLGMPEGDLVFNENNELQPNSDVEEGARFQFRTQGGFYTGFRLPTFSEEFIIPGTNRVDTDNAVVANLVNELIEQIEVPGDPSGTRTFNACDKRGDQLNELVFALEAFQSSRRQR